MNILQSLRNIWDIPDLRRRVLFTLSMLSIYRLGSHIPTPGINSKALVEFIAQNKSNVFGLVDMFSGGNLSNFTIFALGIMPYISSSIILQLLTVVWPYLERISKEGELGRRKITQFTRYGTVLLAMVQSFGIALWLERTTLAQTFKIVESPGWGFRLFAALTMTTGTAFIMWPPRAKTSMQAKRVDTLSRDSPFARAMSAIERHMMVVDNRSSAINAGSPNAPPAAPLRAAATLCQRG